LSRAWCFEWAPRLILVGLVVELLSLVGLYQSWGFVLFSVAGVLPLAAGALLYLAGAVQGDAGR